MDRLPSKFTYHEGSKLTPRVHYSDVQMVAEVKTGVAPESPSENAVQVLKYLFTVSRYQPQHASHELCPVASRNVFRTVIHIRKNM